MDSNQRKERSDRGPRKGGPRRKEEPAPVSHAELVEEVAEVVYFTEDQEGIIKSRQQIAKVKFPIFSVSEPRSDPRQKEEIEKVCVELDFDTEKIDEYLELFQKQKDYENTPFEWQNT